VRFAFEAEAAIEYARGSPLLVADGSFSARLERFVDHVCVHVRATPSAMPRNPHEVLATREARAQLSAMLERFRRAGASAEPVVIGARRRPEAVVLSYDRYLQLVGGREHVRAVLDREATKIGAGLDPDEALELANRELHAMRRPRRKQRR
jgi:PHD/YefM family antitoxin component YafN of YafNO toxin-antitoxin module